ncbi:MAG: DUF4143 domain-containing protein [Opitutales bacterium]|nr:DUF4143 domain-containing protein [Opitutales bacterium]
MIRSTQNRSAGWRERIFDKRRIVIQPYNKCIRFVYLVRSIPPWSRNAGKRLVKSAKVYWRDSGILDALAGLPTLEHVLGHPLCGASWEGYCIEQILNRSSKTVTVIGLEDYLQTNS